MALVPVPLSELERKHMSRLQWVRGGAALPLVFVVAEAPEFVFVNFDKFWDIDKVLIEQTAVEGGGGDDAMLVAQTTGLL